jgi:hypothetical protein
MRIKPQYKVRDIAGEKVIILQGKYGTDMTQLLSLNSSAEWLYNQLHGAEDFGMGDVTELLLEHYDIDRPTATRDAVAWVEKLIEFGIIER